MVFIALAFLIGVASGLRSFLPLAAVAFGARIGHLALAGTPLAFFGAPLAAYLLGPLALLELVADKMPQIPSRRKPGPFVFRLVSGALAGGSVGSAGGFLVGGMIAGVLGGFAGTIGGAAFRARLAAAFGRDLPAALVEDALAIALVVLAVRPA